MNKQDKKEIMNLIKYKKMLGGRRMNLEEAIERVKELLKHKNDYDNAYGTQIYRPYTMGREDYEPIEVILTALDERYNKGYQDGFKQAKFDCEMDKLDGR